MGNSNIDFRKYSDIDQVKIDPKKIKTNTYCLSILYQYFKDYTCLTCHQNGIFDYERDKQTSELYIIFECYNSHKIKAKLQDYLKSNIKLEKLKKMTVYDLIPDKMRNDKHRESILKEFVKICFECQKAFIIIDDWTNSINHRHPMETYNIVPGNNGFRIIQQRYGNLKKVDLIKIERKISEERKYYENIKEILVKRNLEKEFQSYLTQLKMEIDFIVNIYKFSIQPSLNYRGEKLYFFNLYNMNHYQIAPFDDKSEEVFELNLNLEKMYSKNILSGQVKQFIKGPWKKHEVNISEPIEMIVELEYPCFLVISNRLSFYKKKLIINDESEKNNKSKNKIEFQLISEFEEQNKKYFKMVYLGNHKAIMIFKQYGFLELYSFSKDYTSFNILYKFKYEFTYDKNFYNFEFKKISVFNFYILSKETAFFNVYDNSSKIQLQIKFEGIINSVIEMNKKTLVIISDREINIFNPKNYKKLKRTLYSKSIRKSRRGNNKNLIISEICSAECHVIDIYKGETVGSLDYRKFCYSSLNLDKSTYIEDIIECKDNIEDFVFFIISSRKYKNENEQHFFRILQHDIKITCMDLRIEEMFEIYNFDKDHLGLIQLDDLSIIAFCNKNLYSYGSI